MLEKEKKADRLMKHDKTGAEKLQEKVTSIVFFFLFFFSKVFLPSDDKTKACIIKDHHPRCKTTVEQNIMYI